MTFAGSQAPAQVTMYKRVYVHSVLNGRRRKDFIHDGRSMDYGQSQWEEYL